MSGDGTWRVEADDAWHAAHSSDTFARLRRRFRGSSRFGDAVSNADLGPLAGAPRNPRLKIGGREYSYVRYVEHRIAYTIIVIDLERCRICDRKMVEVHRLRKVADDGGMLTVGSVRMCRSCQSTSWLFHSRMPATNRARARTRKVVL